MIFESNHGIVSSYVFTLGIATVSWKFLKQMVIAKFTVEFEFITLENCGEKAEQLHQFLYDIFGGQSLCLQYAYTVIVNLLLVEHKAVCTMVSLDTFVKDTIPLDNYSQLELSL